jgi:hypothetical protein
MWGKAGASVFHGYSIMVEFILHADPTKPSLLSGNTLFQQRRAIKPSFFVNIGGEALNDRAVARSRGASAHAREIGKGRSRRHIRVRHG